MNSIKFKVLDTVETMINKQNKKGMETYGQSLDDCPVDDYDWQVMISEELIDALQYQQKEISRLNDENKKLRELLNFADLPTKAEVSK